MNDMKGFGIVEVLVAGVIISLVLVGVHTTTTQALRLVHQSTKRTQANFLAEETVEALRSMRDTSWSSSLGTLTNGTDYYLDWSGNKWNTTTTNTLIDNIFMRKFVLESVNRDANDDIAAVGTLDPDTKKVTVTVSWGTVLGEESAINYETGTIDNDLPTFPADSGNGDPAQSFTVSASSNITVPRAELYIKRATADPSDIFLEIRSGGVQGPVLATSNTIDSATLAASLTWTPFTFASPPTLSASTMYYLRLRSIPDSAVTSSGAVGIIHWGYGWPGTYGGGNAYQYVGPSDDGELLIGYDFSFRVYKQTTSASANSIKLETYITNLFDN